MFRNLRVDLLVDYKTAQTDANGKHYFSVMARSEYACTEEKSRVLDVARYSKHMGFGEPVRSQSTAQGWHEIPPGSVGDLWWAIACGKS
jgi:hypothetical protein